MPPVTIPSDQLLIDTWPPRPKGMTPAMNSSGVKVIHTPSGLEVCVNVARSQHKNLAIARTMIEEAVTHPYFNR